MSRGQLCLALLANVLTLQASAAYAPSPGFMGPDESSGVDAPWMMEPRKKRRKKEDDRSVMEVLKQLWGTAEWPPRGKGPNPAQDDLQTTTGMRFGMSLVAFTICFGVGFAVTMGTSARDSRSKFPMHFQALVGAICWRHTHQRAIFMHMIRVAIPTLILLGLSRMQAWLLKQVGRDESQTLLESTGMSPNRIVDGIVGYFLTLAMVYVVMVSMLFFVWHVAAEKQSGFRHLLHVSGLSRSAYLLATAGVDGVLQAALGMLLMIFVSGTLLEVPMVLWTSPVLLFAVLLLLAVAGTTMGYLICLLCPSARFSSMLAQLILAWIIFTAPFAPASPVVPPAGQHWVSFLFPVLPSYRAAFELVSGCVKGRCLLMSDVMDSLHGRWASPHVMFFGTNEAEAKEEMNPAEALVSLYLMALVQVSIGCILIAFIDRRFYPSLNKSGVVAPESTNQDILLQAKGLMHSYGWLPGRRQPETLTLQGVSFEIKRGEMLGLLGPNGAGKTTAIRCITGEEAPQEGAVCINSEMAARSWIGLCPQETVINGDLTVKENLQFFANVRGATGDEANGFVQGILRATRLEEKQNALPDALSGGMRRRLAVGCAMIARPSVVILDEPTTGLDPVSRRGIWETIGEVKQAGGCCLLTTHMLEEAEHLASYLVILRSGFVAAEGSVQALKNQWGQGYMLSIDSEKNKETQAQDFITSLLDPEDQTPVKSQRDGQKTYKFSKDEEALGHLIISIARGKAKHGIRHWGVSQASLEDAYVRIIQQD